MQRTFGPSQKRKHDPLIWVELCELNAQAAPHMALANASKHIPGKLVGKIT